MTFWGLQGVFLTTMAFSEDGMAFTPDKHAVLDVLNSNTIEGCVSVAQAAPRLLFMRSFSHFFEGKPSGLNPVAIIRWGLCYILWVQQPHAFQQPSAGSTSHAVVSNQMPHGCLDVKMSTQTFYSTLHGAHRQPSGPCCRLRRDILIASPGGGVLQAHVCMTVHGHALPVD